jgi:hypothetical protein
MKTKHRPVPSDSKEAVEQFLKELIEIYYPWYASSVRTHYWISLPLQWIVLLSGFATSILAALATREVLTQFPFIRILLIVLPALGSAAATVAVQARLYDRYQLREDGRRSIQNLYNEARGKYAAAQTPHAHAAIYQEIVNRVDEIERQQSNSFFSLVANKRE